MVAADLNLALTFLIIVSVGALLPAEADIGVNWGMLSTHRLSPSIVIDLMKENRIGKVKLFDTDPSVLTALMGSNIEVMVGIPNEVLALISSSPASADVWVSQNVSRYVVKGGVKLSLSCAISSVTEAVVNPLAGLICLFSVLGKMENYRAL